MPPPTLNSEEPEIQGRGRGRPIRQDHLLKRQWAISAEVTCALNNAYVDLFVK